jgi:hypothetical protein
MRILSAYYLLFASIFLLGYAGYVIIDQWDDIEGIGELALLVVVWILPCLAAIHVVLANGLLRRSRPSGEAG